MKKFWKILCVLLSVLVLGMLILDIARVAWCKKPFLRIKTSCEYEANHSVYKELWLWYEYVENSADDWIGGIITKVFWYPMCDVPAWNLTSCKIDNNPENEKYIITSKGPVIVENIQILEEWDLWWFDTKWQWIPVWFWWAAFYYLPYNIENFDEYYSLLEWNSEDKYNILKITINGDYTPWLPALAVLKLEEPSKSEEERVRKRYNEQPENICETAAKHEVEEMHPDNVFINIEWNTWEDSNEKLTWKWTLNFSNSGKNWKIDFECSVNTEDWSWTATYWEIHFDEFLDAIKSSWEKPQWKKENSPEIMLWNDEENILVVEDENMNTDYVINLKIWDKTLALPLEKNSATKALIEKLQEWDVIVNAREYWWFEKVGNLGFDLPREDKQITTEPGDLVLYQWNQISLFYESNSWSYTKLWKLGMISKDGLKEILWDWDVQLVFSLLD